MSRDEWVEAGAQASATYWEDGAPDDLDRGWDTALARERERVAVLSVEVAELRRALGSCRMRAALLRKALDEAQDAEETLDGLRERVMGLPPVIVDSTPWSADAPHSVDLCVRRADVLALFDGRPVE